MEDKEILYDHYKDTFEQQKEYLTKRDRLTVLLLLDVVLLIMYNPNDVGCKLNAIISAQVDNLMFDFQVINTGLVIILFWLSLQYYMVVLQIEKMYKYIAGCEEKLSESFPGFDISREGAYYLKSYPWLKWCADKIFVLGIPIGFVILTVCKIINEWHWGTSLKFVDIVFLILTAIFSLLYMSNRMLHEEPFSKKSYPNLNKKERVKRYFKGMDNE